MQTTSSRKAEPVLKAGLLGAFALWVVFAASLLGAPAAPEQEFATAPWALLEAVTTVSLDTTTLSGLGLQVSGHEGSVRGHALHPLSVVPAGTPSFAAMGQIDLRAAVGADGFHGFEGGALRHRGGFLLRGPAGTFDLSTLELRVGAKATVLELVDATGEAVLTTEYAQWELDKATGELRYLNADLRPSLALARKLGDKRYATVPVGLLDLDATLQVGENPPGPPVGINAPPPCGNWSGNVDVGLVDMSSIGQAGENQVTALAVRPILRLPQREFAREPLVEPARHVLVHHERHVTDVAQDESPTDGRTDGPLLPGPEAFDLARQYIARHESGLRGGASATLSNCADDSAWMIARVIGWRSATNVSRHANQWYSAESSSVPSMSHSTARG